jgi:hypothetical protein
MTCFKLALFILAVTLLSAPMAFAFSTENSNDAFKGNNASNFTDPDEQQPAFLTGPGDASSQSTQRQPSVSIDRNAARENYMGLSQGFDHAYAHQQQ